MKNILWICIGIIVTINSYSQDKEYKQFFYPNGIISSEGYLVNGKPDGLWKSYYPNGVVKSIGKRTNHILDSIWSFYNDKGDLVEKITYIDGNKNGYTFKYFIETKDVAHKGNIQAKLMYINNQLNGYSFYYYENTVLKERINFTEGERSGVSYEFDEKGQLISINEFIKGSLTKRNKVNRYSEKGKEGKWVTLYDNFQIKEEMEYQDDQLNGVYKLFDRNGNLEKLINYENNQVIDKSQIVITDVIEKVYKNDKQQKVVGTFKSNIPTGIHRVYDNGEIINTIFYNSEGKVTSEGIILENGSKTGNWVYYYDNGNIASKGKYRNDKKVGNWTFFYENGTVSQKGNYTNGKFNGDWIWFYQNGDTIRSESYNMGYENGRFIEYDKNKNVILKGQYVDGLREGFWYYEVGDHKEMGNYVSGLKDGKWKHYYHDGTLKYEGNYIQGSPDGRHKLYYINGNIKEEKYYVSGFKEGNWKKYDELGNLLITITYKNDKEIRINGLKISDE